MEKKGKRNEMKRTTEGKVSKTESVEPVFQEMYVKLAYGEGEEFDIPQGILNYYSLDDGDALLCQLMELRDKTQKKIQSIRKDILVDVEWVGSDDINGKIPAGPFALYKMKDYRYALLKIKKAIKQK